MDEITKPQEFGTMTEALGNYLDTEQAPPSTLRKFLGNLASNIGEITGYNITLPELMSSIQKTQSMNERYGEHLMPTDRNKYPPIPSDSLGEYEDNAMNSMASLATLATPVKNVKKLIPEAKFMVEDKLIPRPSGQISSYHAVEDVQPMKKK